jgi:hypothetical protein
MKHNIMIKKEKCGSHDSIYWVCTRCGAYGYNMNYNRTYKLNSKFFKGLFKCADVDDDCNTQIVRDILEQ